MALQDRVRELIEHGYDDDVIIMTLGLSNSQLDFIKEQIKKTETVPKIKTAQKSKLQLLRERYFAVYNSKSPYIIEQPKSLSQEKIDEITRRLDKIEDIMPDVIEKPRGKEGRQYTDVKSLYSYLDKIDLPLNLAKRAFDLLPSEDQIRHMKDRNATESFKRLVDRYRSKYMFSIGSSVDGIDDLAELDRLLGEVRQFSTASYFAYSTVQSKILRKKQKIGLDKIKEFTVIPEDKIQGILNGIVDFSVDLNEVKERIEEAAQFYYDTRRAAAKEAPKNSPLSVATRNLTIDSSKRQVRHQVVGAFERLDVEITDPSSMFARLVGVEVDRNVAINTIVQRLLDREKYDEAEAFIRKSYPDREDWSQIKNRKTALTDVRKRRISTFIMRGINAKPASVEEENKYYQMIQNGIDKSYLEPQNIPLGKTRDGRRTITWADVMEKPKVPKR